MGEGCLAGQHASDRVWDLCLHDVVYLLAAGPAAEQVLLLENIATSIKIGPEQLPSVHKLLIEAAQVLEMDPPELYVRQVG